MSNPLDGMLARLARRRETNPPVESEPFDTLSPGAFRAVVDERLHNVERQLDELKGRINGLLFLLAGAVATNIVLRLLA